MTNILEFKEKVKQFYGKYDVFIVPAIKFLIALVSLVLINSNLAYMDRINNIFLVIVIALLCSFLPVNAISLFSTLFIILNMTAVSIESTAVTVVILLIMYLLYFRFSPDMGYVLALTPIMFWLKVPYLVPIIVGLTGGFASIIPVSFGVIIYYLISFVKANVAALSSYSAENFLSRITFVIDGVINNKSMMITIVAFALTVVVVYIIRKLSVDYAWLIAVIAGSVIDITVILIGDYMFSVKFALPELIIGTIAAALIGAIFQFLVFSVEYTRTEFTQFEDDDYYYYVKAVPKINVTASNIKVKKINARNNKVQEDDKSESDDDKNDFKSDLEKDIKKDIKREIKTDIKKDIKKDIKAEKQTKTDKK